MTTDYDEIRRRIVEAFPKEALTIDPSQPDMEGFDGKPWKGMDPETGRLPGRAQELTGTARRVATYRLHRPGKASEPLRSGPYRYPVEVRRRIMHLDDWHPVNRELKWQPHPADLIACLVSEAMGVEQPFDDWCSDCGVSDDSIRARNTYDECQRTRSALLKILGGTEALEKLAELTAEL